MHFTEQRSNTAESSVSTLLRKKKQFKAMSQIENPAFLFTSVESCFNRFVYPNSIVKLTAFLFLPQHTEAADSCSKQGDLIFLLLNMKIPVIKGLVMFLFVWKFPPQ